ncbi:MAG: hypothetical protein MJ227_04550 [Bacilli bacterium]|nr:hypothetical protein [Bacilli bacterium]
MPNINIGIQKENDVIELLNNKYIKDLDNNARFFIERLFDKLDDSESIICERVEGFVKPDFFIKYKKKTKYISMKSGKSSVVHQEDIKKFLNFLREYNVSKRTLQTILYFQFGDGTMDGTGKRRWSYEETVFILKERIKEANDELNNNKDLVIAITERALFQGTSVDYPKATYIYHGDKDYGIVVSEKQIIKHLYNK